MLQATNPNTKWSAKRVTSISERRYMTPRKWMMPYSISSMEKKYGDY
jgi:hypothetical protein